MAERATRSSSSASTCPHANFRDPGLLGRLRSAADAARGRLEVEVTESMVMHNTALAQDLLGQIRACKWVWRWMILYRLF